jgi:hypothetical protein
MVAQSVNVYFRSCARRRAAAKALSVEAEGCGGGVLLRGPAD